MRHVVVVGSGIAGTAAALVAASEGESVTLVVGAPGATVLAGGALDETPWEEAVARNVPPHRLMNSGREVLDALGGYSVGERYALLATKAGIVRPARGFDRAMLDLAALRPGNVMVADVAHAGWDAPALARAWSAADGARAARLQFIPVPARIVARTEEHAFGDADLAARYDERSRLLWLSDRLREAVGSAGEVSGIVVPPWLGIDRERATELSALVGVPCGEPLSGVGGPSGLRFERARDRALAKAGVRAVQGRASRVAFDGGRWRVDLVGSPPTDLACDAVILATGGFVGGGLEYTPAGAYLGKTLPDAPRPLVRATCDAPVRLGTGFGRPLDDPSSLFGGAPERHAWPFQDPSLLDQVGVLTRSIGRADGAPPGLHVAGELAAGKPRTWLVALEMGALVALGTARDLREGEA